MLVKGSQAQKEGKEMVIKLMRERLRGDEELARKLTPDYEVGCRRATPGPNYLESFTKDNITLVRETISGIKKNGIRTADGHLQETDMIICAYVSEPIQPLWDATDC
jgi:cation diffusion facilitator CzcD-associated flavoprotein CzcO